MRPHARAYCGLLSFCESPTAQAGDKIQTTPNERDTLFAPTAPSPGPAPLLDRVLLVGLYKDRGSSIKSYALSDDGSLTSIGDSNAGGNPSWIAAAGPRGEGTLTSLLTVSETGNTVASLSLGCDGKVTETSRVSSQGAGPVHLATDPLGEHAFVANYGGGTVAVLPVTQGGDSAVSLGEATQTVDFGASAHAHSTYLSGGGVYVPTLGLDQVQQLTFEGGKLSKAHEPLSVPQDQGPRHLAFHPTLPLAVLANEGNGTTQPTIELLGVDAAQGLSTIATYEASGPYSPPDLYPAEVLFSPGGSFVLVSVRDASTQKRDGIAVFQVGAESLTFKDYTAVGHYPRSMTLTKTGSQAGLVIVGNQKDNSLTLLNFDLASGALHKAAEDLPLGDSPAFVGIFETAKGCAAQATLV